MNKEELGQRLINCKNWQWLDGMLTTCNLRVVEGGRDYIIGYRSGPTTNGGGWYDGESKGFLPDLSDPATIGCLVHLIRLAWKAPIDIHESRGAGIFWGISIVNEPLEDDCPYFMGYSQQEILVKAFEAAPASLEG
jgi:hypothetical protein